VPVKTQLTVPLAGFAIVNANTIAWLNEPPLSASAVAATLFTVSALNFSCMVLAAGALKETFLLKEMII
jgi:hypothetical protein